MNVPAAPALLSLPLPGPSSQAWILYRLALAGPPEVLFSVFGFRSGHSRRAVKGTEPSH